MSGRRALLTLAALGAASAVVYLAGPAAARRWLGLEPLASHLGVVAVLFALYAPAVRLVLRGDLPPRAALGLVLGFAALFRVLLLPTPVYLSSDLYRYLWDGRVQLAGVSPYRYAPAAPELAGLRDAAVHPAINRAEARTIYPPAAEWLFALAALATGGGVAGWRLVLLGLDLVALALLVRLLPRLGLPPPRALVYAWSPLVILEGVQAGHVDLAVVPLVLLAAGWLLDGARGRAGLALGLAVLVKLYPAVLVVAWWRRGGPRLVAAAALAVAAAYAPYAALHGRGALGFLPEYFGSAEDHNIGLRALLTHGLGLAGEGPRAVAMVLLFVLLAAALVAIARARQDGAAGLWRAGALAAGAYLLLVPTSMHPWYVIWIVPFLCATVWPAWLYFTAAVSLSYVTYLVAPAPFPWWAWVAEYLPFWALLLAAARRARPERRAPALGDATVA